MRKALCILMILIMIISSFSGCNNLSTHADQTNGTTNEESSFLLGLIDQSKVWTADWVFDGYTYRVYFVFEYTGDCYFALDDGGYEIWSAGVGTYRITDDNCLEIEITFDTITKTGIYSFDPAKNALTLISQEGIVGSQGDVFLLKADIENDVEKVKGWARSMTEETEEGNSSSAEQESLQDLNNAIIPLTDSSLGVLLNAFRSQAYALVLSNSESVSYDALLESQANIVSIIDTVIYCEVPIGYSLVDTFESLTGKLNMIKNAVGKTVTNVYDKDYYAVSNSVDVFSNVSYLAEANTLQNKISSILHDMEKEQSNMGDEVLVSVEQSEEKAYRVARYITNKKDVALTRSSEFYVTSELEGKYYEYYIVYNETISILIDVKTSSAIVKTETTGSTRYEFINDGELPAEENDCVVPNLIGITPESAQALLESMGCQWELSGYLQSDTVEEGLICHQYPSAGKLMEDDTIVRFMISIK